MRNIFTGTCSTLENSNESRDRLFITVRSVINYTVDNLGKPWEAAAGASKIAQYTAELVR